MISRSCVKFGRHFCCSYQILAEDWFLCNQITSLNHNLIFLFWTLETATEFNKKPLTAVQGRQCPAGTKMTFPDDFSKGVLNLPGNLTGYCMRWTVKASKTCDLHRPQSANGLTPSNQVKTGGRCWNQLVGNWVYLQLHSGILPVAPNVHAESGFLHRNLKETVRLEFLSRPKFGLKCHCNCQNK